MGFGRARGLCIRNMVAKQGMDHISSHNRCVGKAAWNQNEPFWLQVETGHYQLMMSERFQHF